jgi:hypothetical protein
VDEEREGLDRPIPRPADDTVSLLEVDSHQRLIHLGLLIASASTSDWRM